MNGITAVIPYSSSSTFHITLKSLNETSLIKQVIVVHDRELDGPLPGCDTFIIGSLFSGKTLHAVLAAVKENVLVLIHKHYAVQFQAQSLIRFAEVAKSAGAGIIYSDYYECCDEKRRERPVIDYQLGSIRDDFDFGPVMVFYVPAIHAAVRKFGLTKTTQFSALYELRLKIAMDHPLIHLQEFLYAVKIPVLLGTANHLFDYVDPGNRKIQKEREAAFTDYLKLTGAYLKPRSKKTNPSDHSFPVEASIVIPVRNRKGTITEAIKSALAQKTDFPFNLIIIDNHSNDGTTKVIARVARQHSAIVHITPKRLDLGIGGCWNEAIYSGACGRYAVQLDSDDLYSGAGTLQRIVDLFRKGRFAMIVGSYTLVDENRNVIPPGLVDHREWTLNNGHNNLLRINGIGAPRAFNTEIIRSIGFPNVSYGEDYAVSLRISREWQIGRIYESLYLCRRWRDNTDASLSPEYCNRNNAFKDKLRTIEIMARKALNKRQTR